MNSSPAPTPFTLFPTASSSNQSLLTIPQNAPPLPRSSAPPPEPFRPSSDSDDSDYEYTPRSLFPAPISHSHPSSRRARLVAFLAAINPPLRGGLAAMVCGVIGPVRRVVFERGWGGWVDPVTQSLFKLGGLFSAFQMCVVPFSSCVCSPR